MERIENHPILGETPKRKKVTFSYDGKLLEGYEGEPIATALKAAGVMAHRYTARNHEPRGIFCAIGRCTDCVMIVDGISEHALHLLRQEWSCRHSMVFLQNRKNKRIIKQEVLTTDILELVTL